MIVGLNLAGNKLCVVSKYYVLCVGACYAAYKECLFLNCFLAIYPFIVLASTQGIFLLPVCFIWYLFKTWCFSFKYFWIKVAVSNFQDFFLLTLFRMGRGAYQFFSCNPLQTMELASKSFWVLILTLLPHCCKVSSLYLVLVPNYLTWTKTTSQKKAVFLFKSL